MDSEYSNWILNNNLSDSNNNKFETLLNELCFAIEPKITYLLDKSNTNNFSIIEKMIYDISIFHLQRLNKEMNDNIYIEFWFKKYEFVNKNSMHIDCDEYDKLINRSDNYNVPFCSCITYLNDNDSNPTIITDIDKEKYKYKLFDDSKRLSVHLPRRMKHISFNGGKYWHGEQKLLLLDNVIRNIFVINLWDKKPLNVPYFNYNYFLYKIAMNSIIKIDNIYVNCEDNIFNLKPKTDNVKKILISENNYLLSSAFFEKLLYNNTGEFHEIQEQISLFNINNLYDTFIFEKETNNSIEKKENINITSKNTNLKELLDVSSIKKFDQRYILKNYLTKDTCIWIINECEKYATSNSGWMTNRHNNYPTTDLPIELIPSVFSFFLSSFKETLMKEIIKYYSIADKDYHYEINDLFIVKYEKHKQTHLSLHDDDCCLTINILLSDINEFTGGGTYFEDDITTYLNQGDAIVHSSKTKHAGVEITEGKRYLLVFFINIYKNT
jgi:hypothetical protein